jgi:uncharacterized membrane protein YdjX (TVP38/TMEM64 family)
MKVSRVIDRFAPLLHWDDHQKSWRMLFALGLVVAALVLFQSGVVGDAGAAARDLRAMLASGERARLTPAFVALFLGGLLFVPFQILVLVAVVWLGALRGGPTVVAATALSATIAYGAGRLLGAPFLERLLGRRIRRLWYALHGHAPLSVAILHVVTLFSSTSVHVLCGASRVPPRSYAVGAAIGMAPTLACGVVVGALLRESIVRPSPLMIALTVLVSGGIALLGFRVRRALLARQQDAFFRAHGGRSEHG